MRELLNKFLTYALLMALIAVACFAASLVEVHGTMTVSFGKQELDPKIAALAMTIPDIHKRGIYASSK